MSLPTPKLVTAQTIEPGGVQWELRKEVLDGCWTYWHAECYRDGRLLHVSAAMDSPEQVEAYVQRMYPGANRMIPAGACLKGE